MKKILFIISLLFLFSCTNSRFMQKKELANAINKNKVEIYRNNESNLNFFIEENNNKFQYTAKIPLDNKDFYDISYIEKAETLEKKGENLEILDKEVWENIQKQVFEKIVPEEKLKGVLFLIHYYEIVAYRDKNNQMVFSSFQTLPKEVEIIEKYENDKFMELTFSLIEEFTKDKENDVIFSTSDLEKEQMPYVYFSKDKNMLISLYNSYSGGENHQKVPYLLVKNAFGLINNPATVIGRLAFYLYNSAYVLTTQGIELPNTIPPLSPKEPMNLEEFIPRIQKMASKDINKGKIEYLIGGEDFFFDFINSIKKAEENILIRTYIFDNDDYAIKIADLLKEKSKEVDVKILMDEFGSKSAAMTNPQTAMPLEFVAPKNIQTYLEKNSKVKTRSAKNPWFTTDHNKYMIFDKNIAYMGGMNIGKEYRYEWHDMMIKTEGPIIGVLAEDFYEAWAHSGLLGDLAYFTRLLTRNEDYDIANKEEYIDILPIYTKTGKTEILKITLEAIKSAKKEILIENAYFSDDQVIKELIKARQRGVEVKIILPYWGNHNIMNSSNMVTANILMQSGIKVYLYPKMNHVKASIFDGFAMVGTANYDKLSMRVNQEINFCFWDENAVDTLKRDLFDKDFKESMLLSGEFPILWVDYLLEKVANQL